MATPLTITPATPLHMLVLIGGGEFSFGETRSIDEFLIANMPADRRTIAFLPTASGSAEYATHIGKYFRGINPTLDVVNVPIYRGRDNRRPKNLETLRNAGLIYVGGGVTNTLLETMRGSAAETTMREAAANGAIVAGIGSSGAAFGARVRDMRGRGILEGLGWFADTAVDAGFDAEDDVELRRLMSLPDISIGIGIPPQVALVVRSDGSTTILGEGRIAVFRKPARGL